MALLHPRIGDARPYAGDMRLRSRIPLRKVGLAVGGRTNLSHLLVSQCARRFAPAMVLQGTVGHSMPNIFSGCHKLQVRETAVPLVPISMIDFLTGGYGTACRPPYESVSQASTALTRKRKRNSKVGPVVTTSRRVHRFPSRTSPVSTRVIESCCNNRRIGVQVHMQTIFHNGVQDILLCGSARFSIGTHTTAFTKRFNAWQA